MDSTAQAIQQAFLGQALAWIVMVWIVAAICTGLWASELKKRRFWAWFTFSMLTGPIAWYLLLWRVGIAIPAEMRMSCPHCGTVMRKDMKRCPKCRRLPNPSQPDRAADIGRQAATAWFTARSLLGNARRAADRAAAQRKPGRTNGRSTATKPPRSP